MPITSNNTAIMSRRQSFNGKGLTFIEVVFDDAITATATTPDTKDSTFQKVRDSVLGGPISGGTLLAQSYRLGAKATVKDAEESTIEALDSIDVYQFIVEGGPATFNTADSTGDVNHDPHQKETSDPGVIADAEADMEADILTRVAVGDSAKNVYVSIRYLPNDGVAATGDDSVYGMFDQRGDA
jgi:hypothetical protein